MEGEQLFDCCFEQERTVEEIEHSIMNDGVTFIVNYIGEHKKIEENREDFCRIFPLPHFKSSEELTKFTLKVVWKLSPR